jgi:hypothetical protein
VTNPKVAIKQLRPVRIECSTALAVIAKLARPAKRKPPRHIGITKTGGARSALSSGDCRNLGATVVVVTDGRCGASGRYCHMNDGNAACIDVMDKPG